MSAEPGDTRIGPFSAVVQAVETWTVRFIVRLLNSAKKLQNRVFDTPIGWIRYDRLGPPRRGACHDGRLMGLAADPRVQSSEVALAIRHTPRWFLAVPSHAS